MVFAGVLLVPVGAYAVDLLGRREFDAEAWRASDQAGRAEMADDLIDSQALVGVDEAEVVRRLGDCSGRLERVHYFVDANHVRSTYLEFVDSSASAPNLRISFDGVVTTMLRTGAQGASEGRSVEPYQLPTADEWEGWSFSRRSLELTRLVSAFEAGQSLEDDLRGWKIADREDEVVLFYDVVDDRYHALLVQLREGRVEEVGKLRRWGD